MYGQWCEILLMTNFFFQVLLLYLRSLLYFNTVRTIELPKLPVPSIGKLLNKDTKSSSPAAAASTESVPAQKNAEDIQSAIANATSQIGKSYFNHWKRRRTNCTNLRNFRSLQEMKLKT